MTPRLRPRRAVAAALAALVAAAAAGAAGSRSDDPAPLRLPADIIYESAADSPAAVVFRHAPHVELAGRRCVTCHPQPFRILKPAGRIRHADMEAGRSCGLCHDGSSATGTRDPESCAHCHTGRPAAPAAGGRP